MKTTIIIALCNKMTARLLLSFTFFIFFPGTVYCGEFRDYRLPSQQYQQSEPEQPVKLPRRVPRESRNIYADFEEKFRDLSPDQREELIQVFSKQAKEAEGREDFEKTEYYRTLIDILKQGR